MSRNQAEEHTRALVGSLGHSLPPDALTTCVKELNRHLITHPACKLVVWQVPQSFHAVTQTPHNVSFIQCDDLIHLILFSGENCC